MLKDTTIAARVSLELRRDLERLVELGRYPDLTHVIRAAAAQLADRELNGAPAPGHLFSPRPGAARRTDPETSKRAARNSTPRTGTQRHRALIIIAGAGPAGRTTDETIERMEATARALGHSPPAVNGIARRVTDLREAGAIEPMPVVPGAPALGARTRKTRHGADAIVWTITYKGRQWLREAA